MLSVNESAQLLQISPTRVRALIAEGTLPAQKVGHAWTLRDEDVLQRVLKKPRNGRPRKSDAKDPEVQPGSLTADFLATSTTDPGNDLHDLYLVCRDTFSQRPDARLLEQAKHPEEASFYVAMADFFLQQKQWELIQQGVY